jgi:glycosyltransferase involved in cell wall biosynthesis
LISVPDRGPLDAGVVIRLFGICRHLGVRIWHGHDYKSNLLGLLLRPFHRMQLVTTVHGWVYETRRTPLYYAVDRRCLPHYQHVIAVSENLAEQVRRLGVPDERCTVLHNAIDERTFSRRTRPAEPSLRSELNVPAGRLIIGAVGRLSPEKAFDNLIEATAPRHARAVPRNGPFCPQ